ncbi:hypothetical protein L1887_28144 [Cichorium endivia]|nr:hypothetical protein L1887_28144 [Cichorium endivia]
MCIEHIYQNLNLAFPDPRSDDDKLVMVKAKPYTAKTDTIFGEIRRLLTALLKLADSTYPAVISHINSTAGVDAYPPHSLKKCEPPRNSRRKPLTPLNPNNHRRRKPLTPLHPNNHRRRNHEKSKQCLNHHPKIPSQNTWTKDRTLQARRILRMTPFWKNITTPSDIKYFRRCLALFLVKLYQICFGILTFRARTCLEEKNENRD